MKVSNSPENNGSILIGPSQFPESFQHSVALPSRAPLYPPVVSLNSYSLILQTGT